MHVQMNYSQKMTNHLADPEIGFYVCDRLFLKVKKSSIVGVELARYGARAQQLNHSDILVQQ